MRRIDLGFICAIAAILLCASAGFSQAPLQIPLGTNVVGAVAMSALTLQSPPVHVTGGQDTEIPLTVFFRRKVDHESTDVSASARFSLDVTVRVRASTIAAVAGVTMAEYDNMSTLTKLQASSAVGLQLGVPKLRAVLTALYTGVSADGADVSAPAASYVLASTAAPGQVVSYAGTSAHPSASDIVLASSDADDSGAEYVVIPAAFTDRAAALCGAPRSQKPTQ